MGVFIRGQSVSVSSESANSGVFIGQNRQDGWDSIAPEKRTNGFSMGDASVTTCNFSGYFGWSYIHQTTQDADIKGNQSASTMR